MEQLLEKDEQNETSFKEQTEHPESSEEVFNCKIQRILELE